MEETGKKEQEITLKDISAEFLKLRGSEFIDLLRQLRNEPGLKIVVDFSQIRGDGSDPYAVQYKCNSLKAFLESNLSQGQKRTAAIRSTPEEYKLLYGNALASGVKWINSEAETSPK